MVEGADKSHTWIIDPLDGTTNFLHGLPIFAISIGLVREGQIVAGLVYNPANDDMFIAEKGQGAYYNNRRLRVAARRDHSDALIGCGMPPYRQGRGASALQGRTRRRSWRKAGNIRRLGAAALDLCFVAAGNYDGFWERDLKSWDMAAGIVIVREAGGYVTDADGGADMLAKGSICAGNDMIHRALLGLSVASGSFMPDRGALSRISSAPRSTKPKRAPYLACATGAAFASAGEHGALTMSPDMGRPFDPGFDRMAAAPAGACGAAALAAAGNPARWCWASPLYWPIGLAVLRWKFWQKKSGYQGDLFSFAREKWENSALELELAALGRWASRRQLAQRGFGSTGNLAFDDWRAAELARLEEERQKLVEAEREFAEFMENLRRARDREEFDRFMNERRSRQGPTP